MCKLILPCLKEIIDQPHCIHSSGWNFFADEYVQAAQMVSPHHGPGIKTFTESCIFITVLEHWEPSKSIINAPNLCYEL